MNWKTERRKISDLVPYDKNPRRLTDKQEADLQKSLDKFNLAEIPAVNTDNVILAGHQRLKIMHKLYGDAEIDVRVPDRKLTKKEVQEYNVRSNKNTGEWDFEILDDDFDKNDLLDWGFEEGDLLKSNEDMLDVGFAEPETEKQSVTITFLKTDAEYILPEINNITQKYNGATVYE